MNDEKKGSDKGGFELKGKKLTVGPSIGFDQGSAYDAMNSEETGIGETGSGTFGGKYEDNSDVMPQPGE